MSVIVSYVQNSECHLAKARHTMTPDEHNKRVSSLYVRFDESAFVILQYDQ